MGAFSEGFMAGLANPEATKGIAKAGSAFFDWMQGEKQKTKADEPVSQSTKNNEASAVNRDPFGFTDRNYSSTRAVEPIQGADHAQIESEKMMKQIEQEIQRFMDKGNPRNNPQYLNQPITPRGRYVDPTYDRRR